ncbi:MAG TPA: methyltransferase domain-containing protein, partial [Jiangellaceae bacterium]|nr:methyltransferase domain-containing protein [Jiangellaceae bacterium]
MNLQRTVFARLYRHAPSVESLPWHREQPPALLERAVAQRTTRGRALDVGCGQGVHAVYLAQQGFSVVAVDFVSAALAATRTRAEQAGFASATSSTTRHPRPSTSCSIRAACTLCPEERSARTGSDWTSGSHREATTCSSTL